MGSDCLPQCLLLCLHCLPLCLQLSQSNKLKKNKACINYPKQNEIKTYTEHQKKGTKMKAKTSVMVKTIASECTSLHNIKWPVLAFNLRGITISCVWHQCNQALLKLAAFGRRDELVKFDIIQVGDCNNGSITILLFYIRGIVKLTFHIPESI